MVAQGTKGIETLQCIVGPLEKLKAKTQTIMRPRTKKKLALMVPSFKTPMRVKIDQASVWSKTACAW